MGTMANGISKCSGRYFQFPGELPTGLLKVLAERCFVVVNVNAWMLQQFKSSSYLGPFLVFEWESFFLDSIEHSS